MKMKSFFVGALAVLFYFVLASPITAQEKAEKKKAEKASGDVGLLDLEKNYMILVTKEGKLITLDFDKQTKATVLKQDPAKMSDIGLGSSAMIEYTEKGEKRMLTNVEFMPAKGGD
jgi:outer membrane protease